MKSRSSIPVLVAFIAVACARPGRAGDCPASIFGGVIVVVSHHNYDKIPAFFDQLRALEIDTFHMNIASSVGRGAPLALLGTEKTYQAFKASVDCMLHHDGAVIDTRMISKINQFLNPPASTDESFKQLRCDNMFCHAGVTMVAVQHDGNVYPCGCAGSSGNMKNFVLAKSPLRPAKSRP